jgi:CheY-like chemotaxis protein
VDGCDAVELLEQDPARFSCVLLDLSMPNMNGDTCFSELRRLRPDLPVILVSGSGDRGSLEFLSEAPATAFIHKPYSMTALRRELQRLMRPRGN